jgi:hypothetical protein
MFSMMAVKRSEESRQMPRGASDSFHHIRHWHRKNEVASTFSCFGATAVVGLPHHVVPQSQSQTRPTYRRENQKRPSHSSHQTHYAHIIQLCRVGRAGGGDAPST